MSQQYYMILSRLNGMAVDVDRGITNPGTKVSTYPKNGSDGQLWYDHESTGTIRSKLNDFCLELRNGKLALYPYQAGNVDQQWKRQGNHLVYTANPVEVLDIAGKNKKAGADLIKYKLHGNKNQCWSFESPV